MKERLIKSAIVSCDTQKKRDDANCNMRKDWPGINLALSQKQLPSQGGYMDSSS